MTNVHKGSSSIRLLKRCQTQRTQYQRSELNNAMQYAYSSTDGSFSPVHVYYIPFPLNYIHFI